jgi:mitochondrial fission factor
MTKGISGTKSAPREIMLENSILESGMKSRDQDYIRLSTPPRVITLSEHHFPSASDEPEEDEDGHYFAPKTLEFNEDLKRGLKNRKNQMSNEMVVNHR